jgi:hypothetical protein
MTIRTSTRTLNANGKTIEVTLERGTWEDEIRLDGTLCGTKTIKVDRTTIALYDHGKRLAYGESLDPLPAKHSQLAQAIKAGSVGIVGNVWFVQPATAAMIRQALAEVEEENPKTPEMIAIESAEAKRERIAEENQARVTAEQKERASHPGWCKRCQSYTYGDCGHI